MSNDNSDTTGERHGQTIPDTGVLPDDDDCTLDRFVRNRFFHGKLMTARDMQLEQEYHADRLETLSQHTTGSGAVCGLSTSVTQEEAGTPLDVTVEDGYALDRCGRPVLVDDTAHESFPPDHDAFPSDGPAGVTGVAVYIRLKECHTEKVPIPGSEDACREDCTYNRVTEDFEIQIDTTPPDPKSVPHVDFPDRSDLETYDEGTGPATSDPGLQTVARTYYEDESADGFAHEACDEEGDPRVFLGYYANRDGASWELLDGMEPRHYVYTNDMLYAAIARHAADFGNPHDVVTSVDSVAHDDGNVELVSADDSVVSEPGTDPGTVNLEVAGTIQRELDAIAEYVRDKTLKYTIEVFYEVAERYDFDDDSAREVNVRSRAIILIAREALAEAVFEDEFRFAAVALYVLSLEADIRDEIETSRDERAPIASDESSEYYARVIEELTESLPDERREEMLGENGRFEEFTAEFLERLRAGEFDDDLMERFLELIAEFAGELAEEYGDELDVTGLAVAQDQVAEAAGWLERGEEPATMVLPGGEQEVDARIIELARDRRGGAVQPRREVSLDGGPRQYTVGQRVNVGGTASGGVDEVAVVARDREAWEIVQLDGQNTLSVETNGTFGIPEVRLSEGQGGGNDILSVAGSYRIGVIDAADISGSVGPTTSIPQSDFESATTDERSIRVLQPQASISLREPTGELFIENETNVRGTTSGGVEAVVILARNLEEWGILELDGETTIEVSGDGTFARTGVVLGQGDGVGNRMFAEGGDYRIGAVDAADVSDISEITLETSLSQDEFEEVTADSQEITVIRAR